MNSFNLNSSEAKKVLGNLKKVLNKVKTDPKSTLLEVHIKLEEIEFKLVGMSGFIKIKNNTIFSLQVPFLSFYKIIQSLRASESLIQVEDNFIKIGNFSVRSPYICVIHPENSEILDLPLNTHILNILALRYKYSEEELRKNNYLEILEKKEQELEDDMSKIRHIMFKYNVYTKIVEDSIYDKIREYSNRF
ncbi:MAG: hypothetical protein JW866_09415 [Ignavibacteriales bacterium]|nr:hypothetical protein [Ignavibacteriales bacterium]